MLAHMHNYCVIVDNCIWGRGSEKGPSAYNKNFQERASKSTRAIKMYA